MVAYEKILHYSDQWESLALCKQVTVDHLPKLDWNVSPSQPQSHQFLCVGQ